ncbi:hypothetical protein V1264_007393 [Littorina saxatilis]|uniref:Secreted protein n=1 Tax=Littorina saxatilis TaxID=31220 RepID=A0AAN9G367_9CAEN
MKNQHCNTHKIRHRHRDNRTLIMKFVILLGLVAFAAAQGGHNANTDHGDPLRKLAFTPCRVLGGTRPAPFSYICFPISDVSMVFTFDKHVSSWARLLLLLS